MAWLTMDSKVPLARGLSHVVYLEGAELTVDLTAAPAPEKMGLAGTRGGPKPCMDG